MNLIINGFHNNLISPVISKLLNEYKVRYCEIIVDEVNFEIPKFTEVKTLSFRDLSFANYHVDENELIPLDAEIIEKLRDSEAIVLKMFDRLEKYVGTISYNKRKYLYLKHLRYWNNLIETKKIDLFISSNIPHEIYDYIIYSLCEEKNIPTFLFYQSIPDIVFFIKDWRSFIPLLEQRYKSLLNEYEIKQSQEIILKGRAKSIFLSQTSKIIDPTPVYMKKVKLSVKINHQANKIYNFIRRFFKKSFFQSSLDFQKWSIIIYKIFNKNIILLKEKNLIRFYNKHCSKPDFSQQYVYFPLHLQPELTTSPIAGAYVDQLLIVEMISSYLPDNIKIYIKENPKQRIWGRNKRFYKDLLKVKNVQFISKKINTFELINNCIAVATATGTAGWEAIFRNKPVLMFGNMFYQYNSGVFKIFSKEDCENAVHQIIYNKVKPTTDKTKLFLMALEETTIEANKDYIYQSVSNLNKMQSVNNLYNAIKQEINKLNL